MMLKLLFWGAILFLILGLQAHDGNLFYFFAIHLLIIAIGVFFRKHDFRPRAAAAMEDHPDSTPTTAG